jgi:hypothetical protein
MRLRRNTSRRRQGQLRPVVTIHASNAAPYLAPGWIVKARVTFSPSVHPINRSYRLTLGEVRTIAPLVVVFQIW